MVRYLAIGPRNEMSYSHHATIAEALSAAARDLASGEWVPAQIRAGERRLDIAAILAALAHERVVAA